MRVNKKDFIKWIEERHTNWRAGLNDSSSCPVGSYLKNNHPKNYKYFLSADCTYYDYQPWVQKFISSVDEEANYGSSKISRKRCLEILDEI